MNRFLAVCVAFNVGFFMAKLQAGNVPMSLHHAAAAQIALISISNKGNCQ